MQNLNLFITWVATFGKQALLAYEDKKITFGEIASFLPLGLQVSELLPKADAVWEEIKNAETTDIVNSLDHLESQLTYLKPETRKNIKNSFGAALFGVVAVRGFMSTGNPPIDLDGE